MNIRIRTLSERPSWLPVIAEWIYEEWWGHVQDASPEKLAEILRPHLIPGSIPVTLAAEVDEKPVGTVSLLEHDVETEEWPELTPWLAALFVDPKCRRFGVGTRLLDAAASTASSLGFDVLYLTTSGAEDFYARRGWVPLYRSNERVVMFLSLAEVGTAV